MERNIGVNLQNQNNETQINPQIQNNVTQINPQNQNNVTQINPQNQNNVTQINPQNQNNVTQINPQNKNNVTEINPQLQNDTISVNTILGGKYKIIGKMNVQSGEADLYFCTFEGRTYVAKIYRREVSIKDDVLDVLRTVNSPYIAKIYETGLINRCKYEILPYYRKGSLKGKKYTYEELRNKIIPCINEGLHVLHESGIIHKDLKPSNIMMSDDEKNVAIIDFGISSIREDGNTVIVTRTGLTPEYSAPETFKNLFLNISDYYSLGITVYELFCGETPYSRMTREEIERFVILQTLPMPDDMPEKLKNLIIALTFPDITSRNDKSNPNRRWAYEEVNNWIRGIEQTTPRPDVGDIAPYKFMGKSYIWKSELVEALYRNWEQGKQQLYRRLLAMHFIHSDAEIAGYCMDAVEKSNSNNEDAIFFDLLYKIDPTLTRFVWKKRNYSDLKEFGDRLLAALKENYDAGIFDEIDEMLSMELFSKYLTNITSDNNKAIESVKAIETTHRILSKTERQKKMDYYMLAYMLSGNKVFYKFNHEFKTLDEIVTFLKIELSKSYDEFERKCFELIDRENNLDSQFEAWLNAIGKSKEINKWRSNLSS